MALYTIESPNSSKRCWLHDDCKENDELSKECWASRHTHVWSVRGQWFDGVNADGSPHIVQRDVYESYVGRVVAKGVDHDVRVMSDVWDDVPYCIVREVNGAYRKIETYSGPGYGPSWDPAPYAEIDAPAEDIAAYKAHVAAEQAAEEAAREASRIAQMKADAEREAKTPRKGKRVRVVRGRKVPKGLEGEVIWYGEGAYGWRVGIKTSRDAEPVWTAASNVEVVT